jgi:hypothetical protein
VENIEKKPIRYFFFYVLFVINNVRNNYIFHPISIYPKLRSNNNIRGGKHWTNEIPLVFLDDRNDWKSMNVIIIKLFKKMNWNIILFCCDFLQCLLPVLSGCFECKKNTSIWLKQTIKRRERKKKPKKRETIEKKRK